MYVFAYSDKFAGYVKKLMEQQCQPTFFKDDKDDDLVLCLECKTNFSRSAITGHVTKMHGYRNPLKRHIYGTICLCCFTQFHTRRKLVHHVMYQKTSVKCQDFWKASPQLEDKEFQKLEQECCELSKQCARAGKNPLYSQCKSYKLSDKERQSLLITS